MFLANMHGLHRKGLTIASALQKILIDFKRKPSKIWADKGSEFYT